MTDNPTTQTTDPRQAMASYLCNMFYAHESGEPDQYLDMADDVLAIAAGAPREREGCRPRTETTPDAACHFAAGAATAFLIAAAAAAIFKPSWVAFIVVALIIGGRLLSRMHYRKAANAR